MKIWISSGSERSVLAEHGSESPSGLQFDESGLVQIAEFVRAEEALPLDRGNRRTALSFSVAREHDDIIAAQRFLVEHAASLIRTGLLTLEFLGSVGQRMERYLPNACIESIHGSHIGATTFHQYQITAGVIRTTKP